MAGTGFVACRSPSHPTARALLGNLCVAAPSANKFGHVSPTCSRHVWDDLQNEDVWIVEDDTTTCHVGVESTVAKLEMVENEDGSSTSARLTVLRQGAVSALELQDCLDHAGLGVKVVVSQLQRATLDHVANVAPGQTIRHYSPHVPSYLVSNNCCNVLDRVKLQDSVVIDYGQRLVAWKDAARAYRDLSPTSNSSEAAQGIFETLRWAEQVDGAARILFPDLQQAPANLQDALFMAVKDRLTRAASGVVIESLEDV